MRRREFIKSTAIVGWAFALGMPKMLLAGIPSPSGPAPAKRVMRGIKYPRGGCTESSIVSFDKGPFGGDPFGFFD